MEFHKETLFNGVIAKGEIDSQNEFLNRMDDVKKELYSLNRFKLKFLPALS